MAAWKQLIFGLAILVLAGVAWLRFFPGAHDVLASWGIEWAKASTPKASDGEAQSGQRTADASQALVVTQPVAQATINDRLQAIGDHGDVGLFVGAISTVTGTRPPRDRDRTSASTRAAADSVSSTPPTRITPSSRTSI